MFAHGSNRWIMVLFYSSTVLWFLVFWFGKYFSKTTAWWIHWKSMPLKPLWIQWIIWVLWRIKLMISWMKRSMKFLERSFGCPALSRYSHISSLLCSVWSKGSSFLFKEMLRGNSWFGGRKNYRNNMVIFKVYYLFVQINYCLANASTNF